VSVYKYKNRLIIGVDNRPCSGHDGTQSLVVSLKEDLKFFKRITTSKVTDDLNWVVMGRKTYETLPGPLKERYNIVLTQSKPTNQKIKKGNIGPYFWTYEFLQKQREHQHKHPKQIFVIGGSQIYKLFKPNEIYITEIGQSRELSSSLVNKTLHEFSGFNDQYRFVSYSEKFEQSGVNYRILKYRYLLGDPQQYSQERSFLTLGRTILEKGKDRVDRTGVGTVSLFGNQLRFDLSNETFPLLTTRAVPLRGVIEELLFFCRGETDSKILESKGINIWKGNTTREFLDKRGLQHYPDGVMGPMYGWSWRAFGQEYDPINPNFQSVMFTEERSGFDQLAHVEKLLRTDPFSRRIYISNMNPYVSDKMCLEPCHVYVQFYVEEINKIKYLSCYFTMRSSDYFLASVSFNTASYAVLTAILAKKCGMEPKEIVYNSVDTHVYKSHLEQMKLQLQRTPRPFPKLHINDAVITKDWNELTFSDFELIGYFPHPTIKADMAI
jgi:thymidylate synthase